MTSRVPVTVTVDGIPRTLDWQIRLDPKSLDYKIDEQLNLNRPLRTRTWTKTIWLDQGRYDCPICNQHGACTGYSAGQMLATTPKTMTAIGNEHAHKIYHEAKKRDEWTGENYEGSSVLGAMQYLKEIGVLSAYYWATTLHEILQGVAYFGPMVMGIPWYEDMFYPDSTGFIKATGKPAGGHAIELGGISTSKQAVWLPNSWGRKWSLQGGAWLSWSDLEKLLNEDGEFCLPRKTKSGLLSLP
jgi:hypothetical protein